MTGLTIVVLTRQATGVAVGAVQADTFDAHDIVVLCRSGTGTTRAGPESVIVASRTGLWHQRVVAPLTVIDCGAQHEVMVLSHCRIATSGSPETRIVAEFAAVGGRDVRGRPVAEATGNVRWDTRVVLVVVLAQAHIT